MLSSQDINKLSAQKSVSDVIVEKDYTLDWVLWGIAQNSAMRTNLAFKGGTALHKLYFRDWRFSEDLDFTTLNAVSEEQLKTQVSAVINSIMSRSGIQLNLKSIERSGVDGSDWSYEIKIEYVGPRSQATGSLPIIRLHITHDELVMDEPHLKRLLAPYPDLPDNPCLFTLTLEEILSEKLRTVIHQRCYPKDVYDTWRIINEAGAFLNLPKTLDFYRKKTIYRKFAPDFSAQSLQARILRLKGDWESGLKKQVNNLPDFEQVSGDVQGNIVDLFKFSKQVNSGGHMLENSYMMKYQKGDLCVEVSGDKAFVEEKFKWLLDLKVPAGGSVFTPSAEAPKQPQGEISSEKPVSLAEFMNQKHPSGHSEYILCFGYYLEKSKNLTSFNLEDITICYREARLAPTTNFSQYVGYLIRDGRIMLAPEKKDSKKAWQLTSTGEQYVEQMPEKK